MGFIFTDPEQIRTEYKKLLLDEHKTNKDVADALGISPQNLNSRFVNKSFPLTTLKQLCDAIGYDIVIEFKKKSSDN